MRKTRVCLIAVVAAGMASAAAVAQESRSVWDGVYSEEQATKGAVLFDQKCAQCHGPSGEGGGMAPALVGPAFSANFDGQSVGDLFDRNRSTMPPGNEADLDAQQHADVTAALLRFNGFPAGPSALPSQSLALKMIRYLAQKP